MSRSIPESFPTALTDRFVSAFFSPKCDIMLQLELTFDHRLDIDTLRKALDAALDAEPILGCRFTIEDGQAVWNRLGPGERGNFLEMSSEEEYGAHKKKTIDAQRGPALQGAVLHGSAGDRVLLKIAHEAADAGGAKDVTYLVASLYRNLKKDPFFKPCPNITGSRGLDQVMKRVPAYAVPRIWLNGFRDVFRLAWRRASYNPFAKAAGALDREYIIRDIAPERVSAIKDYGGKRDAKLNDVLLAAFLRSLSRSGWDGKTQLRCSTTIDLRKWYLPGGRAESIANLSGLEFVNLGTDPGKGLEETVRNVASFTRRRKQKWIGLSHYPAIMKFGSSVRYDKMRAFFTKQQEKDVRSGAIFPMFTNLGPIDRDRLCFETPPVEARIMVPAGYPPFFGIGVCGYNGGLTVSAAAFPETREKVNAILDAMLAELP